MHSETLWHWMKVAWLVLFIGWIMGNAWSAYTTGHTYDGHPVADEYWR